MPNMIKQFSLMAAKESLTAETFSVHGKQQRNETNIIIIMMAIMANMIATIARTINLQKNTRGLYNNKVSKPAKTCLDFRDAFCKF